MEKRSSELRRDAHHGGWVLLPFQPEREQLLNTRRREWFQETGENLFDLEGSGARVLWSKSAKTPDGAEHRVRVVANAFALYRVEGDEDRLGVGMYDQMRGVGAHEIILESENTGDCITGMAPHHYAIALEAVQARIKDLRNDQRLRSFSWFREWYCNGGGSIPHPHSQLIASAIIPLGLKNELDAAREYFNYKERCLFCDMIRQEKSDGERVVGETADFISYCPFASRLPFEVHLFPKSHACDFLNETSERRPDLAAMIRDTAIRLASAVPGWRVLMTLHTSPVFDPRHEYFHTIRRDFHWHLEFLPHPPGALDWYSRTGAYVAPTPPEQAAAFLRKAEVPPPWG